MLTNDEVKNLMTKAEQLKNVFATHVDGHYENDEYVFFWSGPFSNWHPATFKMFIDEQVVNFTSSEQAMMYLKAKTFDDISTMQRVLDTDNPRDQKAMGRAVKNYDEAHWASVREELSDAFLYEKFYQNENLKKVLLDTGDKHIVEASPYDKVWGIGMGMMDYPEILDKTDWKGINLLGESLMRVREQLK